MEALVVQLGIIDGYLQRHLGAADWPIPMTLNQATVFGRHRAPGGKPVRYFEQLRQSSWQPTFEWLQDVEIVADRINSFHEDYPFRVDHTLEVLQSFDDDLTGSLAIPNALLLDIHRYVFQDQGFAGRWRIVQVRVGAHTPPPSSALPALMWRFEQAHGAVGAIQALEDWYFDFETIHPFQDGNGRVGGIVVAAWSHRMNPGKGWYTVGQ